MRGKYVMSFIGVLGMLAVTAGGAPVAFAHCDGLDGPVAKAAQNALRTGNANLVLIWVQETDELRSLARYDPNDVAAGRRYVRAYVEFIHYVERFQEAATTVVEGRHAES